MKIYIREEYKLEMQMLIMILYFKLAAPICIIIALCMWKNASEIQKGEDASSVIATLYMLMTIIIKIMMGQIIKF